MLPTTPLHRAARRRGRAPARLHQRQPRRGADLHRRRARRSRGSPGVADLFLVHDRPIVRPVDDSVARIGPAGLQVLRRARGFAPLPLALAPDTPCVLALGAQLKSTVALAVGGEVVVSQHLGDLQTADGARAPRADGRRTCCASSTRARRASPAISIPTTPRRVSPSAWPPAGTCRSSACSTTTPTSRPAWPSTGSSGPVLGLAWDGAGLGTDGTLWGGEALVVDGARFRPRRPPPPLPPAGRRAGDARAAARRPRGPARARRRRRGRTSPGLRSGCERASCSACWRVA